MPRSATSKSPFFDAMALVKAPLTCPNNVLSSRSEGMEPAFTGTKFLVEPGRFLVGEAGIYLARVNDIKQLKGHRGSFRNGAKVGHSGPALRGHLM